MSRFPFPLISPLVSIDSTGVLCMATVYKGFPGVLVVKNLPAFGGDIRDEDSIPGWGRSLE